MYLHVAVEPRRVLSLGLLTVSLALASLVSHGRGGRDIEITRLSIGIYSLSHSNDSLAI